jgi:hypothetical protein
MKNEIAKLLRLWLTMTKTAVVKRWVLPTIVAMAI